MRKLFISLGLLMAVIGFAHAQSKPFPQNVNYGNGFKATSITTSTITTNYNNWKTKYLKSCGTDQLRVEFDNPTGTTVSEGQGYGMVISAYMGDRTTFDKLYAYEKARHNSNGNMGWRTNCSGPYNEAGNSGDVAATDGDLDIALALCVASVQWSGSFEADAIARINVIKSTCVTYNTASSRWLLEWRDGTTETHSNSSYFMPGYYRVFQQFTGDNDWATLATNTYDIMMAARNATTGFVGNEVYVNGTNKQDFVDYNGSRTPFRMVLDYVWNGNTSAKNYCDKLTDWANGKGISNVKDGYKIDGSETSSWNQSPAWTGGWACGAMAKSQSVLDAFTAHFNTCTYDSYYASTLRLMYQLFLTGNYWKPVKGSSTLTDDVISVTSPDAVNPGQTVSITVNVSASTNRDLQVIFQNDTDPWTSFVSSKVDLTAGNNQTKTISITIPSTIPVAVDAYQWQVFLTTDGGTWSNKIDNIQKIDVDCNAASTTTKYEAENATLSGMSVASSYSGYSGTGYATGMDATGDKVSFNVNVSTAGTYPLTIRYSVCNKQENYVVINGTQTNKVFNDGIAGCGGWESLTYDVSLNNGNNTIEVKKNWGYTEIDYISLGSKKSAYIATSINSANESTVSIYPNPYSSGDLTINGINLRSNSTVSIFDISGKKVGDFQVNNIKNTITPELAKGLYIIKVANGLKTDAVKLIIK